MTAAAGSAYPASFTFDAPEKVANWRPLVHWLLAIPHFVVLYALRVAAQVCGLISWFAILFTGRMPEGLAGVICLYQRYSLRTELYAIFLSEDYPPFSFATTSAEPGDYARLHVHLAPALEDRNRLTVFFRLLLVIPQFIVFVFLALAAGVCVIIGFFAVLFTGRWPEGLRAFVLKVAAWNLRIEAYTFLLTDEYPPFSLD